MLTIFTKCVVTYFLDPTNTVMLIFRQHAYDIHKMCCYLFSRPYKYCYADFSSACLRYSQNVLLLRQRLMFVGYWPSTAQNVFCHIC